MKYLIFIYILIFSNVASGQKKHDYSLLFKQHKDKVLSLAFNKEGTKLISGSDDKTLKIWNTSDGEMEKEITNTFYSIKDIIWTSNDLLLLASGPGIKKIDRFGNFISTFEGYTTHIWSLSYIPETNKIVAGSYSGKINIWDYSSCAIVNRLIEHEKSALAVDMSQDGKYIASGSLDRTVKLWNANTGDEIKSHQIHSGNIYNVQFHPTGRYVASASDDKTVRLWDIEKDEIIMTYSGHKSAVLSVDFNEDGNYLISGSFDNTIILWEVFSGKKIYSFIDHKGPVNCVRISPDGRHFASASDDKTVILWNFKEKIVNFYFNEQIQSEIDICEICRPRKKGESKEQYAMRLKEAESFIFNLYDKYYLKVIEDKVKQ